MRVECKIDESYEEPYAVLYINKMTQTIAKLIALLEKGETDLAALTATQERKTYFLESGEIELARTEGRDIVCYDKLGKRYILNKPLYELENILDNDFVRISKSAIANVRRISHVEAGFNGTMELAMKNGVTDYISRSFRKAFKERLGLR